MSVILSVEYVLIKKLLASMQYLYWPLYVPMSILRCAEGEPKRDMCWLFLLDWGLRF